MFAPTKHDKAHAKPCVGQNPKSSGPAAHHGAEIPGAPIRRRSSIPGRPVLYSLDEECKAIGQMLFHQLDVDRDEMLTRDELTSARNIMLQCVSPETGGMAPRAGDNDECFLPPIEQIDDDGDGRVNREEWCHFLSSLYEVLGRKEFMRLSGSWANGFHHQLAIPRKIGPSAVDAHIDRSQQADFKCDSIIVMQKYRMSHSSKKTRHQTNMCISHIATKLGTDEPVLIKVYRDARNDQHKKYIVQSFENTVATMTKLQEPFDLQSVCDERLMRSKPSDLFVQMLDFSKNGKGKPDLDPHDYRRYIVTELPRYTLKDYLLELQKVEERDGVRLSKEDINVLSLKILIVIAGLHAKGFLHVNLQPDSFVLSSDTLKLADIEGCALINSELSIYDSSLSFSPCYCSPEWARFVADEDVVWLHAAPNLDLWAVGLILAELVTLKPIMGGMYNTFLENGSIVPQEAALLLMEWLSCLTSAPALEAVRMSDPELHDFITSSLVVVDPQQRSSIGSCLCHPLFNDTWRVVEKALLVPESLKPDSRGRESDFTKQVLHQGVLYKLNRDGDSANETHWLARDMWVSDAGSLCYFSVREGKRLVLLEASMLARAEYHAFNGVTPPRMRAFEIIVKAEHDGEPDEVFIFGCQSAEDGAVWIQVLQHAIAMNHSGEISSNEFVIKNLRKDMRVRNQRVGADVDQQKQEALVEGLLWKMKANGNRKDPNDWFKRRMWISKDGSLVYWSEKEQKELVYYKTEEIAKASVMRAETGQVCKPFAFSIRLPPSSDVWVAQSFFGAPSKDKREAWINTLAKFANFAETNIDRRGLSRHSK